MTSRTRRSAAALAAALGLLSPPAQAAENTPLGVADPLPGYSLTYDRDKWSDEFSVFQMSIADKFGEIKSTLAASDDPRLKPLTRLDSSWTFSAPLIHAPARLGDTVSSSAFWDQPVRMGGLQIGTLQP